MKNVFFATPAISRTSRLTCAWVPTGNRNKPLACVWSRSKSSDAAELSSADEAGRMLRCA